MVLLIRLLAVARKEATALLELVYVKAIYTGMGHLLARNRQSRRALSSVRLANAGWRRAARTAVLDRPEPSTKATRRVGRTQRLPSQGHRSVPGGGPAGSRKAVLALILASVTDTHVWHYCSRPTD